MSVRNAGFSGLAGRSGRSSSLVGRKGREVERYFRPEEKTSKGSVSSESPRLLGCDCISTGRAYGGRAREWKPAFSYEGKKDRPETRGYFPAPTPGGLFNLLWNKGGNFKKGKKKEQLKSSRGNRDSLSVFRIR